jgi:hypothetical protein
VEGAILFYNNHTNTTKFAHALHPMEGAQVVNRFHANGIWRDSHVEKRAVENGFVVTKITQA